MGNAPISAAQRHADSTGQTMTGAGWLDAHCEALRPEYEQLRRAVEPGGGGRASPGPPGAFPRFVGDARTGTRPRATNASMDA